MKNDQKPNPYGKSDVAIQPPSWKLINVIEFSDRLINNQTFTYERMMEFLNSVNQYEDFPEDLSYSYLKRLSIILQDVILDRLYVVKDQSLIFRLHKSVCFCLVIINKKRLSWD